MGISLFLFYCMCTHYVTDFIHALVFSFLQCFFLCSQSSNPLYPWQHCSLASILLFSDLHLPVYVCGLYKHSCSPSAWTICSWPRTHRATQCRAEWLFTHSSLEGEWLGRLLLWKPRLGVCATLIDLMLMTWGWHQAVKEWVTMMNGVRWEGGTCRKGPGAHMWNGSGDSSQSLVNVRCLCLHQMCLGWRSILITIREAYLNDAVYCLCNIAYVNDCV